MPARKHRELFYPLAGSASKLSRLQRRDSLLGPMCLVGCSPPPPSLNNSPVILKVGPSAPKREEERNKTKLWLNHGKKTCKPWRRKHNLSPAYSMGPPWSTHGWGRLPGEGAIEGSERTKTWYKLYFLGYQIKIPFVQNDENLQKREIAGVPDLIVFEHLQKLRTKGWFNQNATGCLWHCNNEPMVA